MNSFLNGNFLFQPFVTEKSNFLLSKLNKYVFKISFHCDKSRLKKIFELTFNVIVKDINVINVIGKKKVFKGKIGFRSDFKKVLFTLKDGYSLDYSKFSEGV